MFRPPRPITYQGTTYPSINAFTKWLNTHGYPDVKFYSIRLALDLNRNLEDVINGKTFPHKYTYHQPIVYQGTTYVSIVDLYRYIKKTHRKVYITPTAFSDNIKRKGVDQAVYRLTHPRSSMCSLSRQLGGSDNLILLRLKHGWSYDDAIHTPPRKDIRRTRKQQQSNIQEK